MFKSKKRIADLEELVDIYKKRIEEFNQPKPPVYTLVQVPGANDQIAFHTKIANLLDDPLYLFYLNQLRRKATDSFEIDGNGKAEFYRGKLAAIGEIFIDARHSKAILQNSAEQKEEE
jgi:hypothetical protein